MRNVAVSKDLVLVGGGHSHLAVLKAFAMRPLGGARVTLISKDSATPYSGMLPGYVAGHYSFDDAHIDLQPLCQFAGARLFLDRVTGIDLENRRILCAQRPPVAFDFLSINTGSTPAADHVPGAREFALPVKPVGRFIERWEEIVARIDRKSKEPFRVVTVGGGAGGVELMLSIQQRIRAKIPGGRSEFHLVTASETILPTHNSGAQRRLAKILTAHGIRVHLSSPVTAVERDHVVCPNESISADVVLWVTNASAPTWIRESGLATDKNGFLEVNDCLQSTSHPFVFGAGDVASAVNHPRPKSGVFAVRQGMPLAENLSRALFEQPLKPFTPQNDFLSLISTGRKYAVASRGGWSLEGEWVWRMKDWIDRRWMRQYQVAPTEIKMRCGGCAAKVGSNVLARVLTRLKPMTTSGVMIGLDAPDDAAVITPPPGKVCIQTIDFFRSFIDDPYLFGKVAANHCLGDIFAMGAEPHSALALALIPHGLLGKTEEELFQLMTGGLEVLSAHNTALIGGHTGEAAELGFGLTVNGFADPNRLLRKGGMKLGDRLILVKPIGTGVLFAADMQRRAKGAWISGAIQNMLLSNRGASACFLKYNASACTDVTGFGLLGHVGEMAKASRAHVEIMLADIPVLVGALELMDAGIFSSLQPENERQKTIIANVEQASRLGRYPILFDPQTAGGLLGSVPESEASNCLTELKSNGYKDAAIIGTVRELPNDGAFVSIV